MDPWIHFFNVESKFLWRELETPILENKPDYAAIRVWFVVRHLPSDSIYLWHRTLSHGKRGEIIGWRWNELESAALDLIEVAREQIEKGDYNEFLDFAGWTGYPYPGVLRKGDVKVKYYPRERHEQKRNSQVRKRKRHR